jgi:hypothetical protein
MHKNSKRRKGRLSQLTSEPGRFSADFPRLILCPCKCLAAAEKSIAKKISQHANEQNVSQGRVKLVRLSGDGEMNWRRPMGSTAAKFL